MPVTRISASVDWSTYSGAGWVDRLADDVDDAAEHLRADGNHDRITGVDHRLAAHEALGGVHRDGADRVLAEMLRDFQNETLAVVVGLQRVHDLRQVVGELHVHDGADDLGDLAFRPLGQLHGGRFFRCCFCHRVTFP